MHYRLLVKRIIAATVLAVCTATPMFGCATMSIEEFSWSIHPNLPIEPFTRGKLGVIQSSFARSYLVIAYRYLSGHPLSKEESDAAASLINRRLGDDSGVGQADASAWLAERKKVMPDQKDPASIETTKNISDVGFICNCQKAAFETAAKTLADRINKFGLADASIKEWVTAQDIVFLNCQNGSNIPKPLPATSNKLQQQDRNYQIAAAHFYAGEYAPAVELFKEIGKDTTSPWNAVSRYLAVRALLRQATTAKTDGFDSKPLEEAKSYLDSLLKDSTMSSWQPDLHLLGSFIADRLQPNERFKEVAQEVTKTLTYENLDEYTKLFDSQTGDSSDYRDKADKAAAAKKPLLKSTDDLTDWIDTYQSSAPAAHDHALQKWQSTHSLAWLIAALEQVKTKDSVFGALADEANKTPLDSSAFPTVSYQMAQFLMAAKKFDQARATIDKVLALKDLDLSSRNLFLSLRLQVEPSMDAYIKDSFNRSCGTWGGGTDEVPWEKPEDLAKQKPYLLPAARQLYNANFPVEVLQQAALSKLYPADIHRVIAKSVWVRAALLENWDVATMLAKDLINSDAKYASLYKAFLNAKTSEEKKFAAAFQIVKDADSDPNLGERMEYEHWWWSQVPPGATAENWNGENGVDCPPLYTNPVFLKAEDKKQLDAQIALLKKLPTAPTYLPQIVVAWAKAHPSDPRVPEALHLAVRCTRYGDKDKNSSTYSKEAFTILHKQYAKSHWTSETPYYY